MAEQEGNGLRLLAEARRLGLAYRPMQWIPYSASCPGVRWPAPEADHFLRSSAEFKNVWIGASQPGFRKISLGVPREIAYYYYYYYYYYYLLHLSCHSLAVVLTLV